MNWLSGAASTSAFPNGNLWTHGILRSSIVIRQSWHYMFHSCYVLREMGLLGSCTILMVFGIVAVRIAKLQLSNGILLLLAWLKRDCPGIEPYFQVICT